MVTNDDERQRRMTDSDTPSAHTGPIAAFDFDGTLTTHDSFMAFLRWRSGPLRYGFGLFQLIPASFCWIFDRDRGRLKAAAVKVFLKGVARSALKAEAERFANEIAHSFFRPDALETWRRHKADGVTMVIVTASPDLIVAPFAARIDADVLIGTRLRFDSHDRVEGGFDGVNCRGPEKVRRLRESFGDQIRPIAAYGDTSGDIDMLALAEAGHMGVFTGRPQP